MGWPSDGCPRLRIESLTGAQRSELPPCILFFLIRCHVALIRTIGTLPRGAEHPSRRLIAALTIAPHVLRFAAEAESRRVFGRLAGQHSRRRPFVVHARRRDARFPARCGFFDTIDNFTFIFCRERTLRACGAAAVAARLSVSVRNTGLEFRAVRAALSDAGQGAVSYCSGFTTVGMICERISIRASRRGMKKWSGNVIKKSHCC